MGPIPGAGWEFSSVSSDFFFGFWATWHNKRDYLRVTSNFPLSFFLKFVEFVFFNGICRENSYRVWNFLVQHDPIW